MMDLLSFTVSLALVLDPFGNIPAFQAVLKDIPPGRRTWIILRELGLALAVLVLFLFFGQGILSGLHLRSEALGVAGGVVLLIIALRMIFPAAPAAGGPAGQPPAPPVEPFLVPLAIPLVAGPSALSYVILAGTQLPGGVWQGLAGLSLAWAASLGILLAGGALARWLGPRVLNALERLMGMILTTLAVQMLLDGLAIYLRSLE